MVTYHKMDRETVPCEFDICLSNRCNQACRYCYFAFKRRRQPESLSFKQITRAVEIYLSHVSPSEIDKISLGGGEPFLDYPLLQSAVNFIRKRIGSEVVLEVFTNGTLLTRARACRLLDQGVKLIVSLDGKKETNDLNRVFWRNPGVSVFDTVMSNLEKLPPECMGRIYAGLTFTSGTAPLLGENVEFLLGLGFKEVLVDLDILEVWPPERIAGLKQGLTGIRRLCSKSVRNGFGDLSPFGFSLDFVLPKDEVEELRNLSCFREISLAPDGGFYPNGLVATHGPEKVKYRIGDLKSGIDFTKMQRLLKKAAAFFSKAPFKGYAACPVHIYFDCFLKGIDPMKVFRSGEQVFLCATDEVVGGVAEFEEIIDMLAGHPSFGDFTHPLRRVSPKEVGCLKLSVNHRLDLARAREWVDLFLYSPGREKRLVILLDETPPDFKFAKCISVYSLMKAEYLGKRLHISVRFREARFIGRKDLGFLREHGMILCLPAGEGKADPGPAFDVMGSRFVKAVINLNLDGAGKNLSRFKNLEALGFENIHLEPPDGLRFKGRLEDILRSELEEIEQYVCRRIESGKYIFMSNFLSSVEKASGRNVIKTPSRTRLEVSRGHFERVIDTECRRFLKKILVRSKKKPEYLGYVRELFARARAFSKLFSLHPQSSTKP